MSDTDVPRLSRRHEAGSASARGLLFTVLGEFALPDREPMWTSTAIEVFRRLDIEEKTTRQALMRTTADGWLRSERQGRRTCWHLTDAARAMLTDGAERIYSFAQPAQAWDGTWLLVAARIPENDRRTRHMLRTRLSWAGLGFLGAGLWLSTHPERRDEIAAVLVEAGIGSANIFEAATLSFGDPAELVRESWDLTGIETQYEQFIEDFQATDAPDPLVAQIELVHSWRRFPAIDPALPPELLPERWSGADAARLFAEQHRRWAPAAQVAWAELNSA